MVSMSTKLPKDYYLIGHVKLMICSEYLNQHDKRGSLFGSSFCDLLNLCLPGCCYKDWTVVQGRMLVSSRWHNRSSVFGIAVEKCCLGPC